MRELTVYGPRDTFREAGLAGLVKDSVVWFDFIKTRNITVHTYDEEEIEKVLACLDTFSKALEDFLKNIGVPNDSIV
jgi:nucleotidyltransferase substrate binding protein (TIGR01987 family)